MSLLGILFMSTALERKRGKGMGFGHLCCIEEDLFIGLVHFLTTVMKTMWLRFSIFSARLFESHRMTCYSIGVEGQLRVKGCVLVKFLP